MGVLREIASVTTINLRSLPQRAGNSAVIVIVVAGMVGVLVATLSLQQGLQRTFASGARADRAVLVSKGADNEGNSIVFVSNRPDIEDGPGIARTAGGKPIMSGDYWTMVDATARDGSALRVTLRGVGDTFFDLRPEVKLIDGRLFEPAVREVIVGSRARAQFRNLEIGDVVKTNAGEWTIVGAFESNGGPHESEILASADTVISAHNENYYRVVTIKLENADAFPALRDNLQSKPDLFVDVKRETAYYAEKAKPLGRLMFYVAYVIGGVMAAGALFGALNMMYAAVATRTTEIATLRAIGFGGLPVAVSVLAEALVLAVAGALLGSGIAWLLFDGYQASSGASGFAGGQLMFDLTVTPAIAGMGLIWAVAVGLVGGLAPAARAASQKVVDALRAT